MEGFESYGCCADVDGISQWRAGPIISFCIKIKNRTKASVVLMKGVFQNSFLDYQNEQLLRLGNEYADELENTEDKILINKFIINIYHNYWYKVLNNLVHIYFKHNNHDQNTNNCLKDNDK